MINRSGRVGGDTVSLTSRRNKKKKPKREKKSGNESVREYFHGKNGDKRNLAEIELPVFYSTLLFPLFFVFFCFLLPSNFFFSSIADP